MNNCGIKVSVILGSRGADKKVGLLEVLGFYRSNDNTYIHDMIDNFEFYLVNYEGELYSRGGGISVNVIINKIDCNEVGRILSDINDLGLSCEFFEHPNQFEIEVCDPDNRIWKILLMIDDG